MKDRKDSRQSRRERVAQMVAKLAESSHPDFDSLWDYEHPADTEKKFRELLPIALASKNTSYRAQLLTQIARTQGLQRKFTEAHQTLDEVAKLLPDSDNRTRGRYLLERGRALNSSGKPSESKPLFHQAWDMARESGEDFLAVDAAHMIAIVELPENQLDWNLKALDLAEKATDPRARKWKGSLYNNVGWTLFESKEHNKALDMFQKALRWRQEQGQPREVRIAKWCVAKTLRALSRLHEALEVQKTLINEYDKEGERSGYVYEELGECLLALGQAGEAGKFFAMAHEELSKDPWLVENEPARLGRLKELGKPEL